MYRETKDKKKQVPILQDLTGKTKEEILYILADGGEDINLVKPTKKEAVKNTEENTKLPESVLIALYSQLDVIEKRMLEDQKQYTEIAEFIKRGGHSK